MASAFKLFPAKPSLQQKHVFGILCMFVAHRILHIFARASRLYCSRREYLCLRPPMPSYAGALVRSSDGQNWSIDRRKCGRASPVVPDESKSMHSSPTKCLITQRRRQREPLKCRVMGCTAHQASKKPKRPSAGHGYTCPPRHLSAYILLARESKETKSLSNMISFPSLKTFISL